MLLALGSLSAFASEPAPMHAQLLRTGLYLIDGGDSLHISREHFRIDWINGRLIVVDRGSHSGTIVAGKRIGIGQPTDDVEVLDGDTIVVGHSNSPYVFRFQIENGAKP